MPNSVTVLVQTRPTVASVETDSDRLFTAIGKVALTSANLDGQFAFVCWEAAGATTDVGRVLTAGMSSVMVIDRVEILVGMRNPKLRVTTKEICRSALPEKDLEIAHLVLQARDAVFFVQPLVLTHRLSVARSSAVASGCRAARRGVVPAAPAGSPVPAPRVRATDVVPYRSSEVRQPMTKWEYRTHHLFRPDTRSYAKSLEELNEMGAAGREAVAVLPSGVSSGGGDVLLRRALHETA